jgi:hypothetical protein
MPDVVDALLRLQYLGRDAMLSSVVASDPAHDANPVEALKQPLSFQRLQSNIPSHTKEAKV